MSRKSTTDSILFWLPMVIVIMVIGLIAATTFEILNYDATFRYYNDHMTEWAFLKFAVAFLFLQIASILLKFREQAQKE